MKFQTEIKVLGMKASKGELDNGMAYDSTKVYCETSMDTSKGNALGFACAEYQLGSSAEFEKYRHMGFPFMARCEMELVTNGKTQKTVMRSCVPLVSDKKAA